MLTQEPQSPSVSSVTEVLEKLRVALVQGLSRQFDLPKEARAEGGAREAVMAWMRIQHRRVLPRPRLVEMSALLQARPLSSETAASVQNVRQELLVGADLTQRLSRQFYRAKFNDFLFNNFGIHHLHLGARGASVDKTGKHPMAKGEDLLLFVLVLNDRVLMLDVLGHDAFADVAQSKGLVQLAIRSSPAFIAMYEAPGVVGCGQTFESAFEMAKHGFCTGYELDGRFFATGGTVMDGRPSGGRRGACTSVQVVLDSNRVLNRVARLVERIERDAASVGRWLEQRTGVRPTSIRLSVKECRLRTVLVDEISGAMFEMRDDQLEVSLNAEATVL